MAGILAWLGLGILAWISPATIGIAKPFPENAKYMIDLICVVMIFALALMQMQTDIRHEQLVRGRQAGYPGAETASWTDWGKPPKKRKLTANEESDVRYNEYRETLNSISVNAKKNRRARARGYR